MSEQIKETQIMIGNIVTVDNPQFHPNLKDVPMVIKGIYETERGYAVKLERIAPSDDIFTEYSQLIQFIRPIPLTEDILLKCGFELGGYNLMEVTHPKYKRLFFVLGNDFNSIWWNYNYIPMISKDCESTQIELKYLHQLQNLFKALTQTDLKVEV